MSYKEMIAGQIIQLNQKMTQCSLEIQLPEKYCFDVYIDKKPKFKPRLMDVSPWPVEGSELETQPLLFKYEELE